MSKGNGKNGANGNGHAKAPPPPAAVVGIDRDMALAIAHGAAASAFDFINARQTRDDEKLPNGRFWYAEGEPQSSAEAAEHISALADFCLSHPGAPGQSAYLFMTRDVRGEAPKPWGALPLATRQAFQLFSAVVPILAAEVAAEKARRAEEEAPEQKPLPNRGIFRRTIGDRGSSRAERGHFFHGQKGNVARD